MATALLISTSIVMYRASRIKGPVTTKRSKADSGENRAAIQATIPKTTTSPHMVGH